MIQLLFCFLAVGLLFLILDYRPAPPPAQAEVREQERERQALIKELTTFSEADIAAMEEQAVEALYEARRTGFKYQRELRASLGVCRIRRARKK